MTSRPESIVEQTHVLPSPQVTRFKELADSTELLRSQNENGTEEWGDLASSPIDGELHPELKSMMIEACRRNDYLCKHTNILRDKNVVLHMVVNKMQAGPERPAYRKTHNSSQLIWHLDGQFRHGGRPFLSVVYTLYNGSDNSDDPYSSSAHLGGRVAYSNFHDGHLLPAKGGATPRINSAANTGTYYPKTNSLYIFPGYLVEHSVKQLNISNTVRYSLVMFIYTLPCLGPDLIPADQYLRTRWAQSVSKYKKPPYFQCSTCFRTYANARGVALHKKKYANTAGQCKSPYGQF